MIEIRRHINILERKKKGDLKKDVKYRILDRTYFIKDKGVDVVLEELKQRLQAKSKMLNDTYRELNNSESISCSSKTRKVFTNN